MRKAAGFTLIEVLVAMFIILVGVLAAAPMFLMAVRGNATGGDLGTVAAVAVDRMEFLRQENFGTLAPGGKLDKNIDGYFDDSDPDFLIRWTIEDNASPTETKTIRVRVNATRQFDGPRREIIVTSVRGL